MPSSMSSGSSALSLVTYVGPSSGNKCGYCKNSSGSCSFYVQARELAIPHYQLLLDRGWRRSGSLLYKPHMSLTCCPHYTIRLDAEKFKPSRDQRQCLHRWNRHILGNSYVQEAARKYPRSREQKRRERNIFNLVKTVHASEYSTVQHQTPPEPARKLEITLDVDNFTEEKYLLFENYQRNVHRESPSEISRSGFKRFLCNSPMKNSTTPSGMKLGSYHQCYRVDGKLVAMAVLDLLPNCVSAVYFVYHEDYSSWKMGKLSGCREAALAIEGGYRYYYMGFYIHSCIKMRYKSEYMPSDLLDPESYEWNPLNADLKRSLDENKYYAPSAHRQIEQISGAQEQAQAQEVGGPRGTQGGEEEEDTPGSIFKTKMPGLLSLQKIAEFNLGNMTIQTPGLKTQAKNLVGWNENAGGGKLEWLRLMLQDLAATMGVDIAREVVLCLG